MSCIAGELLMQTLLRNCFGPLVSPVVHMLFALGTGAVLLYWNHSAGALLPVPEQAPQPSAPSGSLSKAGRIRLAVYLLALLVIAGFLCNLFSKYPVDMMSPKPSDIIPQIMFLVTRALSGHYPYDPISGPMWGYTLTPTYMPFQWFPYLPAQLLHFDYRWIPFSILFLSLGTLLLKLERKSWTESSKWLLFSVSLAIVAGHYWFNFEENITTVEVLVAAYYLLFGCSLTTGKPLLIATGLILCLLSRYSLVLWLPLFFIVYFRENGLKSTTSIAAYVLAGILVCYAPFLWKKPGIFMNGYQYYSTAATGEWKIQPWQAPHSYPPHLERGLGLAIFFWKGAGSDIVESIRQLRYVHLTCCLLAVSLLLFYFLRNSTRLSAVVFLVASLKIYLAFFYGFIQIPYSYLYILPLLFDIPVLYMALYLDRTKKESFNHTFIPLTQ